MYSARITQSHLNFVVMASAHSSTLTHGSFIIVRLPHLIHLSQENNLHFCRKRRTWNHEARSLFHGRGTFFKLTVGLFCLTSQQADYHRRKEPSRMDFP